MCILTYISFFDIHLTEIGRSMERRSLLTGLTDGKKSIDNSYASDITNDSLNSVDLTKKAQVEILQFFLVIKFYGMKYAITYFR